MWGTPDRGSLVQRLGDGTVGRQSERESRALAPRACSFPLDLIRIQLGWKTKGVYQYQIPLIQPCVDLATIMILRCLHRKTGINKVSFNILREGKLDSGILKLGKSVCFGLD